MSKLFHVLYVLILAAWFGAIVMIAIAIPTLFRTFPDRELAGDAAATIFQSFDKTQMILLPALWVAAIGSIAFRNLHRTRWMLMMIGMCGLTFAVGLMLFRIAPRMHDLHGQFRSASTPEAAQAPRAEFEDLHKQAEGLAKINLFLTLALLVECVWTRNPREQIIPISDSTAPEPVT